MAAKEGLGVEITELRLGLPGSDSSSSMDKNEKKRVFSKMGKDENNNRSNMDRKELNKNQIVGWPPVCSYRKKNNAQEKNNCYVKVGMDGTPFMRKIDLSTHKGYADLMAAFEKLFRCFGSDGVLKDTDSLEYVPIYEDKDGDWMLVGDVPWEMFIESCKRLRIMKRANATGFGLRSRITEGNSQGSITSEESRATDWRNMII